MFPGLASISNQKPPSTALTPQIGMSTSSIAGPRSKFQPSIDWVVFPQPVFAAEPTFSKLPFLTRLVSLSPIRVSLPVPPLSTSLPSPPSITSLPAPPVTESFPPCARIRSLPSPPSITSFPVCRLSGVTSLCIWILSTKPPRLSEVPTARNSSEPCDPFPST